MSQIDKIAAALRTLVDIVESGSMFDTRLASSATSLRMIRADLAQLGSSGEAADVSDLVKILAGDHASKLQELLDAQKAYAATKAEALDTMSKLAVKAAEHSDKLIAERAAHDDALLRGKAQLDAKIKAHEATMQRQAAEAQRHLDAAATSSEAAANLKAVLEAKLAKIRDAAA
jgi:hypothetical protein